MAEQAPLYLDAQGNPVEAPLHLDANGDPVVVRYPTAADMLLHRVTASSDSPTPEPGLVDRLAQSSAVQSMAHPRGLGDMAALLVPQTFGQSINLGLEAMRSGLKAHPELSGITGRIKGAMLGVAERWRGPQPLTTQERATAGTLGRAPSPPPSAPVQPAGSDIWDRLLDEARQGKPQPVQASNLRVVPPPSGLSAVQRAELVRQHYSPEMIARIEESLSPAAQTTVQGASRMPEAFQGLPNDDEMIKAILERNRTGRWPTK